MTSTPDPIRVDIVSDVVCPWCIIGYSQLAKASEQTGIGIEVRWHPFELNPDMAAEGENLRAHIVRKYCSTPDQSAQARAKMTERGKALGFTFNYSDESRMWNTFQAHQLIDWAAEQDRGHDMSMALFEAFFTRGENLSDAAVLAETAAGIGLDRDAARAMLDSGTRVGQLREKEQFWTSRGISGVPAMIFDRKHLVTGAQGEDTYARILDHLRRDQAA